MERIVLEKSGEDIATAVKNFLDTYLDASITAVNTEYDDDISIVSPEFTNISDPLLVFSMIDQNFPSISVFCDDEASSENINVYSIRITSFIREDNPFIIESLNKRFAKAIVATLKRDDYLSGETNGRQEEISLEYGFSFTHPDKNALCISSEIKVKYYA